MTFFKGTLYGKAKMKKNIFEGVRSNLFANFLKMEKTKKKCKKGQAVTIKYYRNYGEKELSRCFKKDDYLLLTGDPAIIGVACSIVSDITNGKYNLLKWDKQERRYYSIDINLYEKGEIDDN